MRPFNCRAVWNGVLVGFIVVLLGMTGCRRASAPLAAPSSEEDSDDVFESILEFRIAANEEDDRGAIDAARDYFEDAQRDPKLKADLEKRAVAGEPPPQPKTAEGGLRWPNGFTYSWVEVGPSELKSLNLDRAAQADLDRDRFWKQVAEARNKGEAVKTEGVKGRLYSRKCVNRQLSKTEQAEKAFDYFMLMRDPAEDPDTGESKAITGRYLISASETADSQLLPAIAFRFNRKGGDLFFELTSNNLPTGPGGNEFYRHLAIILDGQIVSMPRLVSAIRSDGQITGNFTSAEVAAIVKKLRAGIHDRSQ